jgi:hypothetical protein
VTSIVDTVTPIATGAKETIDETLINIQGILQNEIDTVNNLIDTLDVTDIFGRRAEAGQ